MNRRDFIFRSAQFTAGAAAVAAGALPLHAADPAAPAPAIGKEPLFRISLAQWSLNKRLFGRSGATKLDNLCSPCRRHHTFVHDAGIQIVLQETGAFRFERPNGREIAVEGPRPHLGTHPIEAWSGLSPDASAPIPNGDFRRPDYGLAVWTLLQRSELRPE